MPWLPIICELTAKAALRAKFIAADFVTDLRADRYALDDCNSGKHSDDLEGVESTSAIETLLGQAQAIITRLDAAIQNKYSRDPDKLAAWKNRLPHRARREESHHHHHHHHPAARAVI